MKTKVYIPSDSHAGKLKEEVRTLRRNLKEILKHHDEWVLIRGKKVVGFFKSFSAGITEGYERFGLKEFMVKSVNSITRPVWI